jgi:pimeloyl-ACP methyl ester carboxylesterase
LHTLLRTIIRIATHVAPVSTGRWLAARVRIPDRRSTHRAIEALSSASGLLHYELTLDNGPVAVYQWGDITRQPYVLFAHGWSSYGLRFADWAPRLQLLGYAAIAFDQHAHGLSPGATSSPFDFVRTLQGIGRRLGRPTVFVGHSMAASALALAVEPSWHPRCCILIAPMLSMAANLRSTFENTGFSPRAFASFESRIEAYAGRRIAEFDAAPHLPRMDCPALVIHDLMDRMTPWPQGALYASKWPGARMVSTNGLGHDRMVDNPLVIDTALGFIMATRPITTQDG